MKRVLASHRIPLAATLAVVAAVVGSTVAMQLPDAPEVLADRTSPPPAVDAGCDRDGVSISYDAAYSSAPEPGYRVVRAVVDDIGVGCRNRRLTVHLLDDAGSRLASATVVVTGARGAVTFPQAPSARAVTAVAVEIGNAGRAR